MTKPTASSGIATLSKAEAELKKTPSSPELTILDKSLLEEEEIVDLNTREPAKGPVELSGPNGTVPGYQPPVVEELQPKETVVAPQQPPVTTKPAVTKPVGYDTTPAVVSKGEMVTADRSGPSGVMLARIAKHMTHLKGEKGFGNAKERHEEQASFIECVGRSLGLEYSDYVLVTEELITQIRENLKVFTSGDCYRFMHDLTTKYPENSPVKYPKESADRYQAYMAFLVTIARNYKTRQRLRNSVDLGFATKDMNAVGKQNVTKFFNKLTSQ